MSSHDLTGANVSRRRFLSSNPSALALALVCATAVAQAQDAIVDEAAARLAAHDPAAAFAVLVDAESKRAGEPRFDYLLGVAALDSGHVTRAIFALERLVQCSPNNTLGHAELGRAYLAAGDEDGARVELRLARAGTLPEAASTEIDRVISVIDQVAPASAPHLFGMLELGGGYDTNVNSATNLGQFAVPGFGGILFDTAPESRRRSDLFAAAAGGVAAEVDVARSWKLIGAANAHANVNRVAHDMNADLLDATLAVRHDAGTQSQTLALQDGTARVGGKLYRSANGASAQWQAQFGPATQASVFAQWSHQAYSGQRERDTNRSVAGLGYGHDFGTAGTLAYGSVYLANESVEHADFLNFGSRAIGLRAGLEQRFAPSVVWFVEWQEEQRRYGGTEPFFEVARRDIQADVSAGLRTSMGDRWQLVPQVHFTRARSNVVLYEYMRSVFQFTVHRSFQ